MDLSKAFDCVNHGLLIAKLNAYGLNMDALQLIRSYLSKRQLRVKINSSFSDWKEIKIGVLQGSVLGSLLLKSSWMAYSGLQIAQRSATMVMLRQSLHTIRILIALSNN